MLYQFAKVCAMNSRIDMLLYNAFDGFNHLIFAVAGAEQV